VVTVNRTNGTPVIIKPLDRESLPTFRPPRFIPTNPGSVTIAGHSLQEQRTEADATEGTVTFTEAVQAIEIFNTDPNNDGVFTVNGIAINVPKGVSFQSVIGGSPAKTVTIEGATSFILSRYA
jgi:hypothetical protein